MKATRFLLALLATTAIATAGDDTAQLQARLQQLEEQIAQMKQAQQQLQEKQSEQAVQPTPGQPVASKIFQYRLGILRGRSLQPSTGLQPAAGLQPSAAERGAAPAVTSPMSDEQWRQLFPRK
jgi:hypothetical protein